MNLIKNDTDYKEILSGAKARFINTENLTIAEWLFDANIELPQHQHSNEQITKLISGDFELTVDGETVKLKPGDSVVIPPNAIHSGRSITQCHIIDVFHPARDDFRNYQNN